MEGLGWIVAIVVIVMALGLIIWLLATRRRTDRAKVVHNHNELSEFNTFRAELIRLYRMVIDARVTVASAQDKLDRVESRKKPDPKDVTDATDALNKASDRLNDLEALLRSEQRRAKNRFPEAFDYLPW